MSLEQDSWVLVGGLGEEDTLWEALGKPLMRVIGTNYSLKDQIFTPASWALAVFPEYLTHNYAGLIKESTGIIHMSPSLLSCYLAMDMALAYQKPAWILIPGQKWKLLFFSGKESDGCLHCLMSYHPPKPALLREKPEKHWRELFVSLWNMPPEHSTIWHNPHEGEVVPVSPACPLHQGEHPFLEGKFQPIVAVSCGENSVAITPSFERPIDLSRYLEEIKPFVKVRKSNPFFVEIEYQKFTALVFRQGRFIVKGTKEKNTALFLYQLLVGI
ncbi:hypothetical protein [Thermospira aquatica]|uniref:Uncharacterized protein n=1 Tax=Thermospira aquatica TaxID=2828656 RepID=A0AAX3BAK8_9SPIR|nr:hypothetical protein [Thermospira aquatica]URA09293.1 hypothetical protein KDW03_07240 [Thermospira aquatica]